MLVALHEPLICRVHFANVNNQERHLITKTLVEVFTLPSLGPEWGSGKAPKDESDRLVVTKRGELHPLVAAQPWQCEVWGFSPECQGMGLALGNEWPSSLPAVLDAYAQ